MSLFRQYDPFVSFSIHSLPAKPERPEGPLFPEEIRDKHVKLRWKKPKDDGGMPIQGYIIEKMDLDTGIWEPAGEVRPQLSQVFFIFMTASDYSGKSKLIFLHKICPTSIILT
jgi:hypothetical protein